MAEVKEGLAGGTAAAGRKKTRGRGLLTAAGISAAASIAYTWWYYAHVCKPPHVFVAEGELKKILVAGVPNLWRPFQPSFLFAYGHLQTMAGVLRRFVGVTYDRKKIMLPDGGTIALDWYMDSNNAEKWERSTPIVLVMHGLTGGSGEGYCKWMCKSAYNHGWRAVVFNYRGCAGLKLTSPRGYCAAIADDVHFVVDNMKRWYPDAPLFCAAYSMGSIMFCKYMAEVDSDREGRESQILAAGLVSCPVCMESSKKKLSKPYTIPWLYNLVLAYRLRQYASENMHLFQSNPTLDDKMIQGSTTIHDFEVATIRQTFGFPSLKAYHAAGYVPNHIPKLRTKTLILVADDDPFVGAFPVDECLANNHTALVVTSGGGHVAFLQGLWPFGKAWMEDTLMQYFDACLDSWRKGVE